MYWTSTADELQDLYDNAPCAYFSLNADGRFVRMNAKAMLWLGCTKEEALGRLGLEDFLAPASHASFRECFAVLRAHGQVEGLEFDLVSWLGARRRVSLAATAVGGGPVGSDSVGIDSVGGASVGSDSVGSDSVGGASVGSDSVGASPAAALQPSLLQVRCVLHDITELMRAKSRLQALAAEQRAILDNDLVGIIKLNGARTVWKNRTVETMFGYAPGELRGQTSRVLYRSDTDFADTAAAAAAAMARGERFRAEVQMVRKDGSLVWIDLSAVRVSSDTNETVWSFVDVTSMVRRQEQAHRLAYKDPLTGLPNRHQFEAVVPEVIAQAQATGAPAAICFLDLDGFKAVNDVHGHAAGDLLLREMARRITQRLRADDAVYRFGGDEFVLLLPNVSNTEVCAAVVNRVLEGINEPVRLGSGLYARVSASVGVALFPGDGHALEELMHLADQAMYLAKQREHAHAHTVFVGDGLQSATTANAAATGATAKRASAA